VMQYDAPSPFLLPGEKAILMLQEVVSQKLVPVRGWVAKVEGTIVSLPKPRVGPPRPFDGWRVSDFVAQLREVIARN
jgi:hypothetical protein